MIVTNIIASYFSIFEFYCVSAIIWRYKYRKKRLWESVRACCLYIFCQLRYLILFCAIIVSLLFENSYCENYTAIYNVSCKDWISVFVLIYIFLLVYTNLCRNLIKQSRDNSFFEIRITYTIYIITTNRTTEKDTIFFCNTIVSSLNTNQYTLVRLSKTEDRNILNVLNTKIETVNKLLCVEKLNNRL